MLKVPDASTTTYANIARDVGMPGAARAIGNAVGANPISWLIPCHRVLRGDELVSVAPGQTLGEYRVDQVGARSIRFTYLPLKTRQTLDLP